MKWTKKSNGKWDIGHHYIGRKNSCTFTIRYYEYYFYAFIKSEKHDISCNTMDYGITGTLDEMKKYCEDFDPIAWKKEKKNEN